MRVAAALSTVAAVALAAAPFFLSGGSRNHLLNYAGFALVMLLWLVPMWMLPWTIFGSSTVTLDGDVLTAETLRGTRTLELDRVDRIWARRLPAKTGMLVLAGLGGATQRPLWFLWGGIATDAYPEAMADLFRQVARSPDVHVTRRGAIILGLPGHARGLTRVLLWIRGLLLYLAVIAGVCVVMGAYAVALG